MSTFFRPVCRARALVVLLASLAYTTESLSFFVLCAALALFIGFSGFDYLPWGKGGKSLHVEVVESVVISFPPSQRRPRAARDFVRFYTTPNPNLFLLCGTARGTKNVEEEKSLPSFKRRRTSAGIIYKYGKLKSLPSLKRLRASPPLPTGDFNPEVVRRHYEEFKNSVSKVMDKVGIRMTESNWRNLMDHVGVNILIEIMLAGRGDEDDTCTDAWSANPKFQLPHGQWKSTLRIANLKTPCFVLVVNTPGESDTGCVRVVTYVQAKNHILRVWSDNLLNPASEGEKGRRMRRDVLRIEEKFGSLAELARRERGLMLKPQRSDVVQGLHEVLRDSKMALPPGIVGLIAQYADVHRFYGRGGRVD